MSRLIWTPLKLVPPRTNSSEIFGPTLKKFVPTVDQPHQGKSVLVNDHEVTTKDISGVHSGISRKLSDWFSSVCLDWPYAALTKIIAQCTRNRMQRAVPPGMRLVQSCATELAHLNTFQNLTNPPR